MCRISIPDTEDDAADFDERDISERETATNSATVCNNVMNNSFVPSAFVAKSAGIARARAFAKGGFSLRHGESAARALHNLGAVTERREPEPMVVVEEQDCPAQLSYEPVQLAQNKLDVPENDDEVFVTAMCEETPGKGGNFTGNAAEFCSTGDKSMEEDKMHVGLNSLGGAARRAAGEDPAKAKGVVPQTVKNCVGMKSTVTLRVAFPGVL